MLIDLKSQLNYTFFRKYSPYLVLKSNQNGIRLKLNETGDYTNVVSLVSPFRFPMALVAHEEEDEEALIMRRRKERQAIQDAEDEALIKKARAKKMMKDTAPLRAEALALVKTRMDERHAKITALMAEQEADTLQRQRIQSGEMDEALIKAKTDGIKITPTVALPKLEEKANTPTEKVARKRSLVNRKKLYEVLCEKTRKFRIVIDKKEFTVEGNGHKDQFTDGKQSYRSLNDFVEKSVVCATGDDKRHISAYDELRGIQIQHFNGGWEFLGACYNDETETIN